MLSENDSIQRLVIATQGHLAKQKINQVEVQPEVPVHFPMYTGQNTQKYLHLDTVTLRHEHTATLPYNDISKFYTETKQQ